MTDSVFVRLLGPVAASRGSEEIPLGPPRQQAVLAMLACGAGQPFSLDQLVDGLWGERPPRSARQSIYTYVAGLRRALDPRRGRRAPSGLLHGVANGYLLDLGPDGVDCLLLARRLDEARTSSSAHALDLVEQALELWRGPALIGVPGPFAESERLRLDDLRLRAEEERGRLLLTLGRPREAVAGLTALTRSHPLHEPARELLMIALDRAGRGPEAVEVFEEGTRVLREELDTAPGDRLVRCRELVSLGRLAPSVPRQLPRDLTGFVGREAVSTLVRARLAPADGSGPTPVVAISGAPGAGKSALALHVAHRVRDRFPDGQLYVNLHGATPGVSPLAPLDVLGRFLRALGVPGAQVPPSLDEASALWRSTLDQRRLLVVLDNAAGAAQLRPLLSLPAGCAVLVTSRESLSHLDDCAQTTLERMGDTEAFTMLSRLIGPERCAAEREEAERIARLCDWLPLALRIASARLADQPGWSLAAFAARLDDEQRRLQELETGDLAVRASFTTSWRVLRDSGSRLDRQAARALALLGHLHVPDVTVEAAAALLGSGTAQAEAALERLAAGHLLDRGGPGRYHMHDLVRLFSAGLTPAKHRAVLLRALGHYAATARVAARLTDPHRVQPVGPPVRARPMFLADAEQARDWLGTEQANLVAAASQALAEPDDDVARLGVAVTFALYWFQHVSCQAHDQLRLNERVLAVSERLGDDRMALEAHNHVAAAQNMMGRVTEALAHHTTHLGLARRIGDRFCEQRAHANMAATLHTAERYGESLHHAECQLRIATEIGSEVGQRYALMMAASSLLGLGRPAAARSRLERAWRMALESGDRWHLGVVLCKLAAVCLEQGELAAALRHYSEAKVVIVSGARITEIECALGLSRTHRLLGDLKTAHRHWAEAERLAGSRAGSWDKPLHEESLLLQQARDASAWPHLARNAR
ncbi:BTAD domain-containing putative transcriptional regulator [Nonomuraea sp. NPDC050310]|uniref:AfsR/SARP family transcriptional regulator n=1 Tax=Nonomuraea sp. NPDC050310 TaxID=3154935 RepID=UPI0033F824DC